MPSKQSLFVFYKTEKVGKIYIDSSNIFCFEYSAEWLKNKDAFAISHSMPLDKIIYVDAAYTYFSNLLPEGKIRKLISARLGVSEENDFMLLKALGEDCAGAFGIYPFESFEKNKEASYKPIKLKEIAKIFYEQPVFYLGLNQTDIRLSLAGAQDKIALYFDNEQFFLTQNGAASSHILKFPSKDYVHLTENEYFISQLAIDCELKLKPFKLIYEGHFVGLLAERYDRIVDHKKVERLHQEDFCQAMGISYKNKYQEEDGPSFKSSFEFIEAESSNTLEDIEQLLKWIVFNMCVGNCDHHGKNLSLLMTPERKWSLSPFYDLLCTRVYSSISKKQAMSVGGSFDGANLSKKNWLLLTQEIKYNYQNLLREIALPIIDTIQIGIDQHVDFFKAKKSYEFIKVVSQEVKSLTRRVERSFYI